MTLLKMYEFIDSVELGSLVADTYDEFHLGRHDSVARLLLDSNPEAGQDTLVWHEMNFEAELHPDDYHAPHDRLNELLSKLIADGHLPKRDEYYIHLWW